MTITQENVHLFIGLTVGGFTLWDNGPEGMGVSMPKVPYVKDGKERHFNLLRSAEGDPTGLDALRRYILNAYWHPETNV